MKSIYKYIAALVISVSVLVYIIASRYDLENELIPITINNIFNSPSSDAFVVEKQDTFEITDIKDINSASPLNKMYKIKNANAYSLEYSEFYNPSDYIKKGDTFKFESYANDSIYMAFRESYPNISLQEMGVETTEEAYQVVQLLIWELAYRTGEAKYSDRLSIIKSVKEQLGKDGENQRVLKKATELLKYIESDEFTEGLEMVSTLVINTQSVISDETEDGENYIFGPYKYRVDSGVITDARATLTDENGQPSDAKVVNAYGTELDNLKDTDEFYVMKKIGQCNINIEIKAQILRKLPAIYVNENKDRIVVDMFQYQDASTNVNIKME